MIHRPAVWGYGQLLTFSGIDGKTDYEAGLCLRTAMEGYIFEVKNDINLIANFIYVDNILESNYTNFSIYPNPASDFIIVENDNFDQYDMTIYDMTGKVILKKQIDSIKNRINIGELPDGTYIISFNNKTYYKLIINSL